MTVESQIAQNYQCVLDRIETACQRCGRGRSSAKLVVVTKYAELEWVRVLVELGVRDFGESRPQQLIERVPQFPTDVRWHLIGHLQRNKVRPVLPVTYLTHSVDSARLLDRMDHLAAELGVRPHVLLEVNVSGESTKDGFSIDELEAHGSRLVTYEHVQIEGLMTMAPFTSEPEAVRPVFRRLRELRDKLSTGHPRGLQLPELSMGMSRDFEIAIEEGATAIRIGSRLFDGLSATASRMRSTQ